MESQNEKGDLVMRQCEPSWVFYKEIWIEHYDIVIIDWHAVPQATDTGGGAQPSCLLTIRHLSTPSLLDLFWIVNQETKWTANI